MSRPTPSRYFIPDNLPSIDGITKCHGESDGVDLITFKLCENPGLNYGIDSLVPVSGLLFETYRNAYCAKCSGDDFVNEYLYWDFIIFCDDTIVFNRENVWHVLEENDCEVYLKRPGEVPTQICDALPEYSISTCNVSGLWNDYNSTIEVACHAFTDPFNQTYRNYYCYLCNTDKPIPRDEWICADPNTQQSRSEAAFTVTVTYYMILNMPVDKPLNCNVEAQFTDLKKVTKTGSTHSSYANTPVYIYLYTVVLTAVKTNNFQINYGILL